MLKKERTSGETCNAGEAAGVRPNDPRFSDSEKALRADAKQNREQILQAAHKIFAEKGLAVPISEIARQAGIGIGTVYRHFPTKDALFNAVNISYKQELTEEARALITHPDPGKAFFDFFFRIMEEGFTSRAVRDAFRIGTFRVRTATSGVLLDFQSACAELLTRAQQAKAVREDIEVMDLIALMSGLLMAIDEHEGVPNRNRFNQLLSIVCDGLRYKKQAL
ncbi:transcriptional regulator, TetR family [Sporobacter termitidis DSM 10068]|uniref:Transcriptional regulator, TetR family n=1 Tax=Sporobacter termitidis DSM 10068 TaxID=1123282 RepID=A0A1M5YDA5_9FIRM|nr:TetR/AcrR family transcriptional regulator [Sporobacter termitidis]SHI09864.1 transcriptional regulator, TetR family [Sporobacter termitidis DSM 10068]